MSPDAGAVRSPEGLLVVDKPSGPTSHDVVARVRRLAGTRRVGHAGTLDPMATGVLVLGLGRATRLLGHLALATKSYDAVVRLGRSTTTDDADGDPLEEADASGVARDAVLAAAAALTGPLLQVPSSVSAIKVAGRRSYARVRAGESVELAPRPVTVSRLEVGALRAADGGALDVELGVECSSGTYVRAIARDLGRALGVGGHLVALRRTRVGPYGLDRAVTLAELEHGVHPVPLAAAAAAAFPSRVVDPDTARRLSHGAPIEPSGQDATPVAVLDEAGGLLALVRDDGELARPLAVFAAAG